MLGDYWNCLINKYNYIGCQWGEIAMWEGEIN